MVMIYDGSEFKAILNGQKKVVPLIGNSSLINKPRTNISKPELHPFPHPSQKIFEIKKVNRLFNIFQTSKIVYCRPSNLATYFLTSRMCQLIWSHNKKKYFTTFSPIFGYNLSYPCVYLKMHKICVWFIPYTRVIIPFWWHDQLDFEFFFGIPRRWC